MAEESKVRVRITLIFYKYLHIYFSAEIWFERRTNYTRSMACMSMVGHILGLGDRYIELIDNYKVSDIQYVSDILVISWSLETVER